MKRILLFLLLLTLSNSFVFGQSTFKIRGKVTDQNGEPLIGASVVLKSTGLGAATDLEGDYSFDVPLNLAKGQQAELTASFINYKKGVANVVLNGSEIKQNFVLEEDVFQNEEIVVTGIASKTSKSVAEVAVSRITASELTNKQSYQSLSQLVTGKMSGVNVQTSNGNVGAGWRMFIRGGGGLNGNEQPIYFLDGTQLDNVDYTGGGVGGASMSILANINPSDIENIEVLKGPAAAAMYGTNASNGVVLITTKGGKLGGSSSKGINATYQFNYGYNEQSFKYGSEYKNADKINNLLSHKGFIQEHSLSIGGGSGLFKYYTSFQSRKEAGLIPAQNWMDRKTLRANISAVPLDNFTLSVATSFTWNKVARPNDDNNTWGWMLNAFAYYPAYLNVDSLSLAAEEDYNDVRQFVGSAKASWKPLQNLEITGSFGLDYNNWWTDQYYPWGYKYSSYTQGIRFLTTENRMRYTYDWNARYSFNFFDHFNLTTIAGAQMVDRSRVRLNGGGQDFQHPNITIIDAGDPANATLAANLYQYGREAGIYWQNDFSYQDMYYWSLAVRKDYANAFGTDAPSILYPKASAAVRIDKYDILPDEIKMLKLRAAYGESGQLPGRLDGIPLTWTSSTAGLGTGISGNSLGNPKVEPERVKELELGFDMEFLKMFSLEFTYWNSKAEKSLVYTSLANSYGFGGLAYPYNLGEVKSHGFETLLQIRPIQSVNYDLSLNLIWNYQTSEIISFGGTTTQLVNNLNVEKVGYKKHEFFAVKTTTPIYSTTGQLTGYSNTGTTTTVDCGNPIPDHTASFSLDFKFLKNFKLYAFGEAGFNNYVYSYSIYRSIRAGSYAPANKLGTQLGIIGKSAFGSLVKDPNVTPLTPGTAEYNQAASEFAKYMQRDQGNFIYPADYFALRELSLSYDATDLMKEFLTNTYVTNLTLGISVRNVLRISKYDLDYEANAGGNRNAATNFSQTYATDLGTLPQPRTFNFWVKVGF